MKRLIKSYTRRDILKVGAAFAINYFPSRVFGANERLAVAAIGAGGKGRADIAGSAAAGADIVALCDVDPRRGAASFKKYPKAKQFTDFRLMLDKFGKSIDACTVSTPDHTHAVATMKAMGMGKHCYTQKPLAHDIWEARELVRMAAKSKVSTQMGNQAHAAEPIRRVVELVRAGIIGNVTEAHIWTNRPIWPQGMAKRLPKAPVPENVDWDLWVGPAPFREYGAGYLPFKWRGWWNFGTGALGDMACHLMDMAWWSLELGVPTHVEAKHGGNTKESPPNWAVIDYQFPARGKRPPVKLVWYDGKKDGVQNAPSKEVTGSVDMLAGKGTYGTVLVGDKGKLFFHRKKSNWKVTGRDADEVKQIEATTPKSIPRVKSNYTEWLDAAAGKGHAPLSRFQTAGPYTEVVLLGNLAIRANEPVEWSPKNGQAKSDKANSFVRREYRKGWGW